MKRALKVLGIGVISIFFMAHVSVAAEGYPNKPITIVVPFPPGGILDVQSRIFGTVAEKFLGQPMVVVNKAGAAGMIGGLAGAQAIPDGYTLTAGSNAYTYTIEWEIANGRKPPFTRYDFTPIVCLCQSPLMVLVPYDSRWKSLPDMIKDCRAKPEHYAFSSSGLYGMSHLPAEIFMKATGIKCTHVPYKGGAAAISAVVGGHADFTTVGPGVAFDLMKGNKLKALASMTKRRLRAFPDVPTVKELGYDAEVVSWVGILAPKKTPADIVKKLGEVAAKVVKEKSFIDAIENTNEEVGYMSGGELAKYWDKESKDTAEVYEKFPKEKEASK